MNKDKFTNDILNIINEGWKGKRIDSHGRSWPSSCVDIGTIGRDIDSYCRRIKRDELMSNPGIPAPDYTLSDHDAFCERLEDMVKRKALHAVDAQKVPWNPPNEGRTVEVPWVDEIVDEQSRRKAGE